MELITKLLTISVKGLDFSVPAESHVQIIQKVSFIVNTLVRLKSEFLKIVNFGNIGHFVKHAYLTSLRRVKFKV